MRERLDNAFFRYGWLTPAMLPLAEAAGRALFNSLAGIYVLWGIAAVSRNRPRLDRPVLAAYALLLLAFLLSALHAAEPLSVAGDWLRYMLHTLTFLFTLAVLQQNRAALRRALDALGAGGLLLLLFVVLLLPWQMAGADFAPTAHMKEDNLPFLAPFILLYLWRFRDGAWVRPAMTAAAAAVLGYVVMSQGRAALLGLAVMAFVCILLVWRWSRWKAVLLALVIIGAGAAAGLDAFTRAGAQVSGTGWEGMLDRITSARSVIWRNALQNPPDSLWTGVGMGQISAYAEVVEQGRYSIKHLHNFLLDAWYETGLLGVAALVSFLSLLLLRGLRVSRGMDCEDARCAGLLLAAVAALAAAALFSFSYTSRQFSLYLFFLLAMLQYLHQRARERVPG